MLSVEDGDKVRVVPFVFIPKENAGELHRRQKRDRAPYASWIAGGHITATPGNCIDYAFVEARIIELSKVLDVIEIQADPYNASGLLEKLIKAGLAVTTVRQGWSLAQATKEAERMILARELAHPANPALNFQISCAAVKQDEHDNQWVVKNRSTGRVDAVVAMVMSLNALRFGKGREAGGGSYYESNPEPIFV